MGIFGGSKRRYEEAQREAAAELEAAMARAKPPTEAERTWVLPMPEVPDLGLRPQRRSQPRVRFPLTPDQPEAPASDPTPPAADRAAPASRSAQAAGAGAGTAPAQGRRRPPATKSPTKSPGAGTGKSPGTGTAKSAPKTARATTKKPPPGSRDRRPT